jgi:hypothetical protein
LLVREEQGGLILNRLLASNAEFSAADSRETKALNDVADSAAIDRH